MNTKVTYRDVIQGLIDAGGELSDEVLALLLGPVWTIVDNRCEPDRLVEYKYFRDREDAERIAEGMRLEVGANFEAVKVVMLEPVRLEPPDR